MIHRHFHIAVTGALLVPVPALAAPLSAGAVLMRATPLSQALALILLACMVVAIVVCLRKLASGPSLSGGSAFLSALRFGGPMVGLLGASLSLLNIFIGLANVSPTPPISALAHGWAEAAALVVLGMVCGVVAVIANWAVEARIDRVVLRP